MKDSTAIGLGCAFVVCMVAAFLAGMMVARLAATDHETGPRVNTGNPDLPNLFSPRPAHDPYFINQQRKNVEALERACRKTGQYCSEAAQMRQWLAKNGGAR